MPKRTVFRAMVNLSLSDVQESKWIPCEVQNSSHESCSRSLRTSGGRHVLLMVTSPISSLSVHRARIIGFSDQKLPRRCVEAQNKEGYHNDILNSKEPPM